MRHERFEWDPQKDRANAGKHGVSFDLAAEVLADPFAELFHLEVPQRRGGEERWMTLGNHPERRELVYAVVWAERVDETGPMTRIISARRATRKERQRYEREIL